MSPTEKDLEEGDRLLERLAHEAPVAIIVKERRFPNGFSRETLILNNLQAFNAYMQSEGDLLPPVGASQEVHLVALVHGINTRALWQGTIKPIFEQAGFKVAPTSYGVFTVLRFLSPFGRMRRKAIGRVVLDIRTAIRIHKPDRLSTIAHSFGTDIIGQILLDHPDIHWHRVIFCGSVVRDTFPFYQVLDRFDHPLINEVGTKDYWPALAESAGWRYGSIGSHGLNNPAVETRWHHGFRHSDFLTAHFCSKYWLPFLQNGTCVAADPPTLLPLRIRAIAALPLRWIIELAPVV